MTTWLLNQADTCFIFLVNWILNPFSVQQNSLNRIRQRDSQCRTANNSWGVSLYTCKFETPQAGKRSWTWISFLLLNALQRRCKRGYKYWVLFNDKNGPCSVLWGEGGRFRAADPDLAEAPPYRLPEVGWHEICLCNQIFLLPIPRQHSNEHFVHEKLFIRALTSTIQAVWHLSCRL